MQDTARLAGLFAAHGIWCVSDGNTLIPMVAFERADGTRELRRFAGDDLGQSVEQARQWAAENPENAPRIVTVFDGRITLEDGKIDALLIDARCTQPTLSRFMMAVPYRPKDDSNSFAVFRPKFLEFEGGNPDANELGQAFFEGVDSHEKGAEVWNAHIDQSR
ncbi:MAG: hypothetical protein GC159_13290 [Phycisphaera sp.]|nr:hypothetical protein [Phycisphaera sp.]